MVTDQVGILPAALGVLKKTFFDEYITENNSTSRKEKIDDDSVILCLHFFLYGTSFGAINWIIEIR